MTQEPPDEELDRVVSRRVHHPTAAQEDDRRSYRAPDAEPVRVDGPEEGADPSPTTEGDEPTRSE
ncbi:hypothetical protein ACQEVB_25690 [Pseudonocardia sp. CA-107938]|uniref:hypothetical protein n=1 Tax=Pseudonocardia sp. CA-107938 TaxID=3240021 RepID=UPI003D8A4C1D